MARHATLLFALFAALVALAASTAAFDDSNVDVHASPVMADSSLEETSVEHVEASDETHDEASDDADGAPHAVDLARGFNYLRQPTPECSTFGGFCYERANPNAVCAGTRAWVTSMPHACAAADDVSTSVQCCAPRHPEDEDDDSDDSDDAESDATETAADGSEFDAQTDADALCKAMDRWGTEQVVLTDVLLDPRRSFAYLKSVEKAFEEHTSCGKKRSLLDWIKAETSCGTEDDLVKALTDESSKRAMANEAAANAVASEALGGDVEKLDTPPPATNKLVWGMCWKGLLQGAEYSVKGWYDLAKMIGKGVKHLVTKPLQTARMAACGIKKGVTWAWNFSKKTFATWFTTTKDACANKQWTKCFWGILKAHPAIAVALAVKRAVQAVWTLARKAIAKHWTPLTPQKKIKLICAVISFVTLEFVIYPLTVFKLAGKLLRAGQTVFKGIWSGSKAQSVTRSLAAFVKRNTVVRVASSTVRAGGSAIKVAAKTLSQAALAPFKAYLKLWSWAGRQAEKMLVAAGKKVTIGRSFIGRELTKTNAKLRKLYAMPAKGTKEMKQIALYESYASRLSRRAAAKAKPAEFVGKAARTLVDPRLTWAAVQTVSKSAWKATKAFTDRMLLPINRWAQKRGLSKLEAMNLRRAVLDTQLAKREADICRLKAALAAEQGAKSSFTASVSARVRLLNEQTQRMRLMIKSNELSHAHKTLVEKMVSREAAIHSSNKVSSKLARSKDATQSSAFHRALAEMNGNVADMRAIVQKAEARLANARRSVSEAREAAKSGNKKEIARRLAAEDELALAQSRADASRKALNQAEQRRRIFQQKCAGHLAKAARYFFKRSGMPSTFVYQKRDCAVLAGIKKAHKSKAAAQADEVAKAIDNAVAQGTVVSKMSAKYTKKLMKMRQELDQLEFAASFHYRKSTGRWRVNPKSPVPKPAMTSQKKWQFVKDEYIKKYCPSCKRYYKDPKLKKGSQWRDAVTGRTIPDPAINDQIVALRLKIKQTELNAVKDQLKQLDTAKAFRWQQNGDKGLRWHVNPDVPLPGKKGELVPGRYVAEADVYKLAPSHQKAYWDPRLQNKPGRWRNKANGQIMSQFDDAVQAERTLLQTRAAQIEIEVAKQKIKMARYEKLFYFDEAADAWRVNKYVDIPKGMKPLEKVHPDRVKAMCPDCLKKIHWDWRLRNDPGSGWRHTLSGRIAKEPKISQKIAKLEKTIKSKTIVAAQGELALLNNAKLFRYQANPNQVQRWFVNAGPWQKPKGMKGGQFVSEADVALHCPTCLEFHWTSGRLKGSGWRDTITGRAIKDPIKARRAELEEILKAAGKMF